MTSTDDLGPKFRFVSGPLDGQCLHAAEIEAIGVYGEVNANPGSGSPERVRQELLRVPDGPVCERILRGTGFRPTEGQFDHFYERVMLQDGNVEYRYRADVSVWHVGLTQEMRQGSREHARCLGRYFFLSVGLPFAAFSGAPMLLFDTPVGYRVAQILLILLVTTCLGVLPAACNKCHEDEDQGIPLPRFNRVAQLALLALVGCLALFVCMVVGHRWSGWQWLFPVLTGLACLRVLYHTLTGTWDMGPTWLP
ncbi:MAG TPA: hypothetical protein VFA18_24585 [Gemmataceae bacterium]|nr:hypothetical protein [Gemmataceae bacterium]